MSKMIRRESSRIACVKLITCSTDVNQLEVEAPELEAPVDYSPHSLMGERGYEKIEEDRGPEFVTRIRELTERDICVCHGTIFVPFCH